MKACTTPILNAHNILLDLGLRAGLLLDFDRGRIEAGGAWEQDVLADGCGARWKRSGGSARMSRSATNSGIGCWPLVSDLPLACVRVVCRESL